MKWNYYFKHINKKSRGKYDVSTITHNKDVFNNLIDDLIKPFKNKDFDAVVSQEALGFTLGSAVAIKLKKGFVPIRKENKLPTIRKNVLIESFVDYSGKRKSLEMNKNSIKKGQKVLIVDDWVETGEQMKAAIKLIEKQGGKIIGISVITAEKNKTTKILFEKFNLNAINVAVKND